MQTSINLVYSTDGGHTFSAPRNIGGNVLHSQGSRPVVGPDGTVYVFRDGSTRLATLDSTYMVKSTDGGVTWSKPVAISTLSEVSPPANTAFRVNSFPAADVAPNGDLYAAHGPPRRAMRLMVTPRPCTVSRTTAAPPGARRRRSSRIWIARTTRRLVMILC